MSDSGWCDEFVPAGCMCGCEAGVRRVTPDEARKGKMIRVGIFFRPLLDSWHQGRKMRFKLFPGLFSCCSYGCRDHVSLFCSTSALASSLAFRVASSTALCT